MLPTSAADHRLLAAFLEKVHKRSRTDNRAPDLGASEISSVGSGLQEGIRGAAVLKFRERDELKTQKADKGELGVSRTSM